MLKKIFALVMATAFLSGVSFVGLNIATYAVETEEEQFNNGTAAPSYIKVNKPAATINEESYAITSTKVEKNIKEAEDISEPLANGLKQLLSTEADSVSEESTATVSDQEAEITDEASDMVISYVKPYLNIRENGDASTSVVGILRPGSVATVLEKGDIWTKVTSGDITGYINNSFVNFEDSPSVIRSIGISNCPVAEAVKTVEIKNENATQSPSADATPVSETSAKEEQAASEVTSAATTGGCSATEDEIYVLACLLYCEAGNQGLEGQRAVANVVVNRVNSDRFPSTITDVLYQPGQFRPENDYWLNEVKKQGPPESCLEAARQAVSGINTLGNYMFYATSVDIYKYPDYKVLGDHTFYNRF